MFKKANHAFRLNAWAAESDKQGESRGATARAREQVTAAAERYLDPARFAFDGPLARWLTQHHLLAAAPGTSLPADLGDDRQLIAQTGLVVAMALTGQHGLIGWIGLSARASGQAIHGERDRKSTFPPGLRKTGTTFPVLVTVPSQSARPHLEHGQGSL